MRTRNITGKLCSLKNKYHTYSRDVNNAHLPSALCLEKILPRKLFHDSLLLTMVFLSDFFSILFFLGAWYVLRCVLFSQLWYILVFFKLPPPLKDQGTHTREFIILIPEGTHTSFTRLSPFSLSQMFVIICTHISSEGV
jgi:hypothetical protein